MDQLTIASHVFGPISSLIKHVERLTDGKPFDVTVQDVSVNTIDEERIEVCFASNLGGSKLVYLTVKRNESLNTSDCVEAEIRMVTRGNASKPIPWPLNEPLADFWKWLNEPIEINLGAFTL